MITGKTIVLTGANSGIGFEVLNLLVKGDNKILAVDKNVDKLSDFGEKVIPFCQNVGTAEGVEAVFAEAEKQLGKIDIFYANAGFPYYEAFDYLDWERVDVMFQTNTLSPMYSYQRYVKHLNGRNGHFAVTVSAIGKMAVTGYAVYSATKFALNGFLEALRMEMPDNLKLTALYPIATDTAFFKVANEKPFRKPFPVQNPKRVAVCMVKGLEKGRKSVNPSKLFSFSFQLMKFCPLVRTLYLKNETRKFRQFKENL